MSKATIISDDANNGKTVSMKHGYRLKIPLPLENLPIEYDPNIRLEDMTTIAYVAEYKRCNFIFHNDETKEHWRFEFWVPVTVKSPQPYIMEKLINAYRSN